MPDIGGDRLLAALTYAVMALFLGGMVIGDRYRPLLRRGAIILYAIVVALALAWVALWLARS